MDQYENINNSKILIVDDDEPIRSLLKFVLKKHFILKIVESGDKALEVIDDFEPDLIILDVMMPGISGFDVCKAVNDREEYFGIPVIFLTVKDNEEDLKKGFEVGASDYVKKPFSEVELLSRVENILKMKKYFKRLKVMDELKSNFLAMISHDIKTPLTSVMGYADFILSENYPDEISKKTRDIVLKILNSANHQYAIIRDMLSFASLDREQLKLELTSFTFKESISLLSDEFAFKLNDKNIKLIIDLDDSVIFTDKTRVEEVVSNLLSNAIKFSHKSGNIEVKGFRDGEDYIVKIKDYGKGIRGDDMKKLFDKYSVFTTKGTNGEKGTGFGLKICKRLLATLDGNIEVYSKEGEWTEFVLKFPIDMSTRI